MDEPTTNTPEQTTPEQPKTDPKPSVPMTEDGKYLLKVRDKEVPVTLEELYQKASLAHGAHSLMEQAAQVRKESEGYRQQVADIMRRVDEGDPEAYGQVLDIMGVDKQEKVERLRRYYAAIQGETQSDDDDESEEKPVTQSTNRGNQMSELPPKLARAMELAEALGDYTPEQVKFLMERQKKNYFEEERQKVFHDLSSVLENDQIVGKILSKGGSRAEIVRGLAQEKLVGRLRTQQYSPELRAAIVDDIRTVVKELGVGGGGSTSLAGLGPSPGVSFTETQATKPPERKSTDDPDYEQSVLARMQYAMLDE